MDLRHHLLVYSVSMIIIQVLYSYLQIGTPLTLLNGVVEQINVRVERELVHRIDLTHIIQNEKQD